MSFRIILAALMAIWTAIAPIVRADPIQADGITVFLELPQGYCGFSENHPVEKLYLDQQRRLQAGTNQPLMMGAPCRDIGDIRAGKPMQDYVMWLLNTPGGKPIRVPPGTARTSFIEELARQIPTLDLEKINSQVDETAKKEGIRLKIASSGIIDRSGDALFVGQVVNTEAGSNARDIAGVGGVTTFSGRVFAFNVYYPFEGRGTFDDLLAKAKDVMRRTIAANAKLPEGLQPVK